MLYFFLIVGAIASPIIIIYGPQRSRSRSPVDYAIILFVFAEAFLWLLTLTKWIWQ